MGWKVPGSTDTLRLEVQDVAEVAGVYARLGLKVRGRTSRRAVVELPCGIHIVLARPAAARVPAR